MRWAKTFQVIALGLAAFVAPCAATADTHHLILCGSGGEAEFSDRFRDWGTRLRDAIQSRLNASPDHVTLLMEPQSNDPADSASNLENIRAAFKSLESRVNPGEDVAVYLIGHGSYLKDESKFQIPGEDLSAGAFEAMLAELPAARVIVVNGTSSSAGFINVLSGPNRVICSATKSVTESNATEFMNFFVEALEDGSADRDHDERITVLELCEQAAQLTASWYTGSNLIATEHAILDDNGDGLGTRLPVDAVLDEADPATAQLDGELAASIFLKDYSFPESAPRELIDRYLATLDEINTLRDAKAAMDATAYYVQLENLLIDAARANRDIRSYADAPPATQP